MKKKKVLYCCEPYVGHTSLAFAGRVGKHDGLQRHLSSSSSITAFTNIHRHGSGKRDRAISGYKNDCSFFSFPSSVESSHTEGDTPWSV